MQQTNTRSFKVGDKVKVKPYLEFDFSDALYEMTQNDVFNIANSVFTVAKIASDGDLDLDTWDVIDYFFTIHPQDVIPVSTKNPRKHAELIKQWADDDSLEIQVYCEVHKAWIDISNIIWSEYNDYRIKPKTVTKWKWAYKYNYGGEDITQNHCSEEDLSKEYPLDSKYVKLEWTAKEFEI